MANEVMSMLNEFRSVGATYLAARQMKGRPKARRLTRSRARARLCACGTWRGGAAALENSLESGVCGFVSQSKLSVCLSEGPGNNNNNGGHPLLSYPSS